MKGIIRNSRDARQEFGQGHETRKKNGWKYARNEGEKKNLGLRRCEEATRLIAAPPTYPRKYL